MKNAPPGFWYGILVTAIAITFKVCDTIAAVR